jgi:hypothetical protein
VWVFSGLAVALALISRWYLLRRDIPRFWISHGVTLSALLVFLLVALLPIVDGYRSVTPFCEQVRVLIGKDKPLYGFEADERLRGLIPFYTGCYLVGLQSLQQVWEVLEKREDAFFVTRDNGGKLERQLIATGRLSVVARQPGGPNQSFVLLRSRMSPAGTKGLDGSGCAGSSSCRGTVASDETI